LQKSILPEPGAEIRQDELQSLKGKFPLQLNIDKGVIFFNRNIPDECHLKMRDFSAAGDDVTWVAFPPGGGNRWSILTENGAFFNRNIPDECHQKMQELSTGGARIVRVAFPPQGGNSWSIVNDKGAFFNRNIPDECHQKMQELSTGGAKIVSVAFPPQGGNSWSIVNDQGAFFNRNIPDECHQKMQELSTGGARIVCVAFPPQGGNSWSIVNDKGAFFNRNISDEAHMYMGFFSAVYGPVRIVAFDMDGNGWSVTSAVTKAEKVCDATQCVSIADVYRNIAARLDGKVVGYACSVGSAYLGAYSHGEARTSANAPAKLFLPSTKIPVASVSKVVTTLAAIRILAKHNINLDSGIGGHLPSDWKLDPHVASITFRQLLSHRSGIKDYGNNDQSYDTLKKFFTQSVDATKNTPCQGANVANPSNPINANDKSPCYSNYNFGIFRVLLPVIDGFVDDPAHRAENLAAAYIKIVQTNVFEPVGAQGVNAKPPATGPQASAYAFSYKYPGTDAGVDWGDDSLGVGAAGWYLAIEDIEKVLYSLNKNDGRILTPQQWSDMQATPLGWDTRQDSTGYRWVEKNGGWGSNGTTISTSIALFGPGVFGALFMNSDKAGPGLQSNWQWCKKCQGLAFAGNASLGNCPAGGLHDHTGSRNYLVAMNTTSVVGQSNWRWCNKCQALSFAGSPSPGQCPAGGQHDHSGSGDYVLGQKAGDLPEYNQDNFQWCKKCQVLAFAGNSSPGACAAGGMHDHTGSGDYILEYAVGADTVLHDSYMKALKAK
jgi:CubicO group peptidase (beta-lactamase class C family)